MRSLNFDKKAINMMKKPADNDKNQTLGEWKVLDPRLK